MGQETLEGCEPNLFRRASSLARGPSFSPSALISFCTQGGQGQNETPNHIWRPLLGDVNLTTFVKS